MVFLLIAASGLLLLTLGTPPLKTSCGCLRCWYVSEAPEDTPVCPLTIKRPARKSPFILSLLFGDKGALGRVFAEALGQGTNFAEMADEALEELNRKIPGGGFQPVGQWTKNEAGWMRIGLNPKADNKK